MLVSVFNYFLNHVVSFCDLIVLLSYIVIVHGDIVTTRARLSDTSDRTRFQDQLQVFRPRRSPWSLAPESHSEFLSSVYRS